MEGPGSVRAVHGVVAPEDRGGLDQGDRGGLVQPDRGVLVLVVRVSSEVLGSLEVLGSSAVSLMASATWLLPAYPACVAAGCSKTASAGPAGRTALLEDLLSDLMRLLFLHIYPRCSSHTISILPCFLSWRKINAVQCSSEEEVLC